MRSQAWRTAMGEVDYEVRSRWYEVEALGRPATTMGLPLRYGYLSVDDDWSPETK